MKSKLFPLLTLAAFATLTPQLSTVLAQGTKFTYQGRLLDAGSPASGNYDLRFTVWDSAGGGLQVGGAVVVAPAAVSSGLFIVPLDFGGGVFTGPARWLQVESRPFGVVVAYSVIAPRQELTASPYAIAAGSLTGTLPDGGLSANVALLNRNPQTFTGQNNFSDNLTLTDPSKTLQFPATAGANVPMITMFASGTANANRMVIGHSPGFPDYGLQYQDAGDKFHFLSGGTAVMTVDLGTGRVGIGASSPANALSVAGRADFSSVGIGTTTPTAPLQIQADQAVARLTSVNSANGSVLDLVNTTAAPTYLGAVNFGDGGGTPAQIGYLPASGLTFRSGNADRMVITTAGRVGIGKAIPDSPLDVNGDIRLNDFDLRIRGGTDNNHGLGWRNALDGPFLYGFNGGGLGVSGPDTYQLTWNYLGYVSINSNLYVANALTLQGGGGNLSFDSANSTIQFPATSGANNPMISMFASGSANANRMVIAHSPTFSNYGLQYQDVGDKFHFLANGTAVMTVDLGTGRVGIGQTGPTFQLQLGSDSAAKPNGGSWANTSDARVKKNIRPLSGALDQLAKLRGVSFEWINPQDHANQTGPQGGFVAQEVERAFPHWVQEVPGAEHDKSLTPNGQVKSLSLPFEFDALVIEALRELRAEKDAKITALEKDNAAMRQELAAQRALTSRMEARFATLEKVVARIGEKNSESLAAANP